MGKIPVWHTVGQALEFAFGRYLPILGVLWLPLLILGTCEYFLIVPMFKNIAAIAQFAATHPHAPPPPELIPFQPYTAAFDVLAYVINAWIAVGITKEALGLRRGPRFVYLSVGLAELRLIGAYLVILAFAIAAGIAIAIVVLCTVVVGSALVSGGALAALDPHALTKWSVGAAAAFGTVFVCALIYFLARLMFLLAPVTVAEGRFGLWRSWQLSKGNFWRIFAIALLIGLVMLALEFVLLLVIVVPAVFAIAHGLPHVGAGSGPAAFDAIFKVLRPLAPIGALVLLAVMPIFYGLSLGPSAFAYRSLMPEPKTE